MSKRKKIAILGLSIVMAVIMAVSASALMTTTGIASATLAYGYINSGDSNITGYISGYAYMASVNSNHRDPIGTTSYWGYVRVDDDDLNLTNGDYVQSSQVRLSFNGTLYVEKYWSINS